MLFLNQIKKDFQPGTWKKGQTSFRESRVAQVKLKNHLVTAEIADENPAGKVDQLRTTLLMDRGTIRSSSCTCSAHGIYEKHCRHVAALASWVLAKGSLLRAGIADANEGSAATEESAAKPKKPVVPKSVRAEPVAFVRAIYEEKVLTGITVESALRYEDPIRERTSVTTLHQLIKKDSENYRTTDDLHLKLLHEFVPVIHNVHAPKVTYQGANMLENLAKLLSHEHKAQIVYHENINVRYDTTPLKLHSLNVGAKGDLGRLLTYEFRSERFRIESSELEKLTAVGRLSSSYCLVGDTLYRFEKSLNLISQFANRSGMANESNSKKGPVAPSGYSYLDDDEDYPLHPLSVYRLSLELGVDDFTVDKDWKDFFEWKKTFEADDLPELPRVNYGFDLRDYQKNGVSWVWSLYHRGLASLLADDMGLGKTHQVLAVLTSFYKSKSKPALPTLVIAPTSVVSAWVQKLEKYPTGLKWTVFHGKGRVLPDKDVNLVLTTYGILQREASLREREWHCVILDEAQAIKNAITISSRASRVLRSKFRVAMTGTPIENHATDLWSIMEFLLPGYLGSLPRFKRLYGGGSKEHPDDGQTSALKRLISPFLLRRTKDQVLKELPEKTEEVILCEMTAAQKKAYKKYLESAEAAKAREDLQAGKKINYANILSVLTRLKQVCDHPKLPEITGSKLKKLGSMDPWETGKWIAFDELLNEALGSNLKIVVFTQYLGMMDLIGLWLKEKQVGFVELRGDTPDRAARIKKYADDPETKVFLCSLLAGSLGIDLTAGSVCIHFDRWWNPARENQATDRLHRLGQTRGVQVFKLQIPGTIEDRIASIIQSKTELSDALIEQSALGLKAFSREELLELLSVPI
ncbi:MAG: DEAD/DEAH box helicase [Bdellovibrionales bacterium]|nr:DEAD/DEAH box helicase [Bdellovibrionales bacterium]